MPQIADQTARSQNASARETSVYTTHESMRRDPQSMCDQCVRALLTFNPYVPYLQLICAVFESDVRPSYCLRGGAAGGGWDRGSISPHPIPNAPTAPRRLAPPRLRRMCIALPKTLPCLPLAQQADTEGSRSQHLSPRGGGGDRRSGKTMWSGGEDGRKPGSMPDLSADFMSGQMGGGGANPSWTSAGHGSCGCGSNSSCASSGGLHDSMTSSGFSQGADRCAACAPTSPPHGWTR